MIPALNTFKDKKDDDLNDDHLNLKIYYHKQRVFTEIWSAFNHLK